MAEGKEGISTILRHDPTCGERAHKQFVFARTTAKYGNKGTHDE
jgi:hypothetical protein